MGAERDSAPALLDGAWPAIARVRCRFGFLAIAVVGLRGCVLALWPSLVSAVGLVVSPPLVSVCMGVCWHGGQGMVVLPTRPGRVASGRTGGGRAHASPSRRWSHLTPRPLSFNLLWSISLVPAPWLPCCLCRVPSVCRPLVCRCVSSVPACLLRAPVRSLCSPLPGVSLVLC